MIDSWKSNKKDYLCKVNQPTMSEDKIKNLENRLDTLEAKLDAVIRTLKGLGNLLDENFTEVISKIDRVEAKVDQLDGSTEQGFKDVKGELKKIQDVTRYTEEHLNITSVKGKA